MIGLAFGNLASLLVERSMILKIYQDHNLKQALDSSEGESWLLGQPFRSKPDSMLQRVLNGMQYLLGIVLVFIAFAASVLYGTTWHNCLEGGDDCVKYSKDGASTALIAGFILVPTIIMAGTAWHEFAVCKRQERECA